MLLHPVRRAPGATPAAQETEKAGEGAEGRAGRSSKCGSCQNERQLLMADGDLKSIVLLQKSMNTYTCNRLVTVVILSQSDKNREHTVWHH
jgi:hypothetical protein